MTCIAGLVSTSGKVYIGGDSAGVGGLDLQVRADNKVWTSSDGDWAFGFTTSFRMGQLLRYSLRMPPMGKGDDLMRFMVVDFIGAVRDCLKIGGFASLKEGTEAGGCFLVGHKGRLFRVDSDYQVGEAVEPYNACGCGEAYAKGVLYADELSALTPNERILHALKAAEAMSAGVRGPFQVVCTER
jgi:hypothetical protein